MSAMHHDTSSDLRVVGSKLKNVLEVRYLPKLLDKIEIIQPLLYALHFCPFKDTK